MPSSRLWALPSVLFKAEIESGVIALDTGFLKAAIEMCSLLKLPS